MLEVLAVARLVEAVAERVEHVALDAVADGHRDRGAGVGHLDAAHQAVGGLQRDAAHQVVAEVLGDLERQRLREILVVDLGVQRVEQLGHGTARELDVDDRAGDAHDAARGVGAGLLFSSSSHVSLRFLRATSWRRPRARSRHRRFR